MGQLYYHYKWTMHKFTHKSVDWNENICNVNFATKNNSGRLASKKIKNGKRYKPCTCYHN